MFGGFLQISTVDSHPRLPNPAAVRTLQSPGANRQLRANKRPPAGERLRRVKQNHYQRGRVVMRIWHSLKLTCVPPCKNHKNGGWENYFPFWKAYFNRASFPSFQGVAKSIPSETNLKCSRRSWIQRRKNQDESHLIKTTGGFFRGLNPHWVILKPHSSHSKWILGWFLDNPKHQSDPLVFAPRNSCKVLDHLRWMEQKNSSNGGINIYTREI